MKSLLTPENVSLGLAILALVWSNIFTLRAKWAQREELIRLRDDLYNYEAKYSSLIRQKDKLEEEAKQPGATSPEPKKRWADGHDLTVGLNRELTHVVLSQTIDQYTITSTVEAVYAKNLGTSLIKLAAACHAVEKET